MLFIAVSGDSQPHFTTLAAFVSELGDLAAKLFAQVLTVCDRQGLIGREMFAIDGVKLPSNAAKARSGRREDYARDLGKMEEAAGKMLTKHREADAGSETPPERELRKLERLQREAKKLKAWLAAHPEERKSAKGRVRLSNRTDNESAKMATSKGVIQGYTGVAAVDEKHQVIVEAQAHGTGSEQELLVPVVEATERLRTLDTLITADAGYHSEANLKELAGKTVEAYICDNGYRRRDERYAGQDQHKAKADSLWDKRPQEQKSKRFGPADFRLAEDGSHCICPAGKRLYSNGSNFQGKREGHETHTDRMKARIDSALGRQMIARRFATVEPVFGNLRGNKRLDRFTLGRGKVDGQWKLYCLTHNVEKLAHHGYAR